MSNVRNKINVVSLYQAGNAIYELFDKVTVIAEGQVIYYGPRSEARGYFEALGFEHMDGANTADYLTAVTALAERKVNPNHVGQVPNSAAEFAEAYRQSDVAARMRRELDDRDMQKVEAQTSALLEVMDTRRNKGVSRRSPYVVNFGEQLKANLIREYQQRWTDKWCVPLVSRSLIKRSFWIRQISTFLLAWMTGSVFYQIPQNTTGLVSHHG
jgi:ATP-binding cassette subfamily G (WHITE) protein 2 (SNQ2)